ncbi:GNAT family N-acetyltransferase [Sphingomonas xanthus]|uniref:GNAT family N-acetyltransferase n=1 Tax=Sphingomonas xanthus TaxID=2594473 RepID=A0A516INX1_9SPHN|nr:GNAT family N-acetyltransferase [Sphingomonas xanthus]QDP18615.1 GNAT family N-acetyltransferase [Sphingomonas xanthus]
MPEAWQPNRSRNRSAPTLETERLLLRHYRKQDFRPHMAIVGDDQVMRFVGGRGISEEDCWRRLAASVGMWDLLGFGGWAVVRKADHRLVGTVSLFNAWRALEPRFGEEPEMGWIFATEVHGTGMASEACRAVLAWADDHLQPTPIWAIIDPSNAPSLALADRLGFQRVTESSYHQEPTLVLKRPAKA